MKGARRVVALRLGPALAAVLVLSACSNSQAPAASASDSAASPVETDMAGFVLTSPSVPEGGAIPVKHSCDGQDLSPALTWDGAPTGTAVFALIVDDPDANGFVHWVAYNIAGGPGGGLAEGVPAAGPPQQGRNGFGRQGYGGPCPPSGTHHYRFTLFALSQPLALTGIPTAADLRAALATGVLLGQTTLTATYTRRK